MVGGAEKSNYEVLRQKDAAGHDIELISFADIDTLGANSKKMKFPQKWKLSFIKGMYLFKRFFYYEYLFNRNKLKTYFSNLESTSELYSYAIYAPVAVNNFKGKSKLFIRSETDLAINKNYHTGIKRYLKYIYMLLEYPAFYIYKKDLEKAIEKSNIICNSKYMARKLEEIYGKKSEVLYPYIDEERLKKQFIYVKDDIKEKGIVFVGDAVIKGINIAKDIAHKIPNEKFYFFSRYYKKPLKENNIIWMPWQKREVDIYKYAKSVIVPSICEEAYGRVSREAYLLDIPVLVSNIGGLPESVDEKKEFIVNDYKNIDEWREKIEKLIK